MTDEIKMYLSTLLEEYKTLRDESKQASINQFASLQIGAALVGVALSAALTQWGKSAAVEGLLFLLMIPMLASFSMFIWLGEMVRFRRVGDYLAFLEQKVGLIWPRPETLPEAIGVRLPTLQREAEERLGFVPTAAMVGPLAWEQWLRSSRARGFWKSLVTETSGHQQLVYFIRLAFFPVVMLVSYMIGVFYVHRHPAEPSVWLVSFLPTLSFLPAWLTLRDDIQITECAGFAVIVVSGVLASIIASKLLRQAGTPAAAVSSTQLKIEG